LGEIYVGEADVQTGFDFVFLKLEDLIRYEPTRADGLLGDLQHGLASQGTVIGPVHPQENVRLRRDDTFSLRLGAQICTLNPLLRAAKVGDELVDGDPASVARIDDGVVQKARGDAAVVFSLDGRSSCRKRLDNKRSAPALP